MLKKLREIGFVWLALAGLLGAFEIDPFPENGTLTDVFNTNCLQMTQSQQMLKAYIMKGLHSTFDNPAGDLKRAIPPMTDVSAGSRSISSHVSRTIPRLFTLLMKPRRSGRRAERSWRLPQPRREH